MKHNLMLVIFGMMNLMCMAQEADHFTMRELADAAEGVSPDDAEIVRKIGIQLDFLKGRTGVLEVYQKSVLIELAIFVRPGLSPEAVEIARDKRRKLIEPYADVPFRQDMDGRELLYFAAGRLGVPIDQREMLDYAKNSGNSLALRLAAFEVLAGQKHLLPELEEDLVALGHDEINYSADGCIGPRTNKRRYPIRNASAAVLKKMKEAPVD
jgi:hypothetical protein